MDSAKNKTRYLLDTFLTSEDRYYFALSPYELCILFIVCRYLDMKNGECFLKPETLARECGMSRPQVYRSLRKLYDMNLLMRITRKAKDYLILGDYFKND